MSEVSIPAEQRSEFGKGAARRIRRADKVPAVLYGHGNPPVHITLPGHATMLALKNPNALLSIELDSADAQLALPKDVQRDPIKGTIEHIDLVVVRRGEKVEVELGVHLLGEAAPETVVTLETQALLVEVEATHIPEGVEVSVEGLDAGAQISAADITLPGGATLVTDAETLVVNVTQARTAEEVDAELAEAEDELGIEHDEPEVDAATDDAETAPEPSEATSGD